MKGSDGAAGVAAGGAFGPYQVCTRCIMDTTDPAITFDGQGHCNHCTAALARLEREYMPDSRGEAALQALLAEVKQAGKGKPYDCVIGLSGGVDSSYVAFKSRDWGLRPLIFHVDSGWNTDAARANVENLASWLGYELHVFAADWEEVRDLQCAYLKSGLSNQDVVQDHLFFATLFRKTEEFGIKYWLSGMNLVTESILPKAWGYTALDGRQIRAVHTRFGTRELRSFPILSFVEYCKFYGGLPWFQPVRALDPLNLMSYDVPAAKAAMSEAFGWQEYGAKHDESRFTKFFQRHYLPQKFGFDPRRPHVSSLIASGQMTRSEALQEIEKPLYSTEELAADMAFVLVKLGLTQAEWNAIMALPGKQYTNYPNYESLFRMGRRVKRLIVRPGRGV